MTQVGGHQVLCCDVYLLGSLHGLRQPVLVTIVTDCTGGQLWLRMLLMSRTNHRAWPLHDLQRRV